MRWLEKQAGWPAHEPERGPAALDRTVRIVIADAREQPERVLAIDATAEHQCIADDKDARIADVPPTYEKKRLPIQLPNGGVKKF